MIKDNFEKYSGLDGFFVDGALLRTCLYFKYGTKVNRISFDYSSIADDFLLFCESNKLIVSFVGATEEELINAIGYFKARYPKLIVGFSHNGYFSSSEFTHILHGISQSDVVIIGMGAPFQEDIAIKIKDNTNVKLAITCGGFITQTAMKKDYYHPLIKRMGLRWLQRMFLHKHVRNKVFCEYPRFIYRFIFVD